MLVRLVGRRRHGASPWNSPGFSDLRGLTADPHNLTACETAEVSISPLRRQLTSLGVIFVLAAACCASSATAGALPLLKSLKPAPAPSGWRLLIPKARGSRLWYPPSVKPVSADPYSVTAEIAGPRGSDLLYLNAGPKTGDEKLSNWPSFRISHIRVDHNRWVREDAKAFDVPFRGGQGSCVIDDYLTVVHANHYREIACFVQGRTAASVIVAATLAKDWKRYRQQLERALEAWQVR
jgi:hypothetical protein